MQPLTKYEKTLAIKVASALSPITVSLALLIAHNLEEPSTRHMRGGDSGSAVTNNVPPATQPNQHTTSETVVVTVRSTEPPAPSIKEQSIIPVPSTPKPTTPRSDSPSISTSTRSELPPPQSTLEESTTTATESPTPSSEPQERQENLPTPGRSQ